MDAHFIILGILGTRANNNDAEPNLFICHHSTKSAMFQYFERNHVELWTLAPDSFHTASSYPNCMCYFQTRTSLQNAHILNIVDKSFVLVLAGCECCRAKLATYVIDLENEMDGHGQFWPHTFTFKIPQNELLLAAKS